MAKLILRNADGSTREVPLDPSGSVTIGRSPECGLPIEDTQASRRHCTVLRVESGYEMSDLGSTNGTTVNGQLVKKKKLYHGDVIRIGVAEIQFHDPSAGGPPPGDAQVCSLVFSRGPRKGAKIPLSAQRTTIGRKETNTLCLEDVVASSYHCEVVRDLNGYTMRDLGSTNGTLVNGEMVTEAPLSHGAKIRIGNTRFVFQDPAMAEIDLEMAGGEEDEPEWGMMRELDLAAVRKRRPAAIVYSVLFLALLGGGAYLMTLKPGQGAKGPTAPAGNLHLPYSFESADSAAEWFSEPAGAVEGMASKGTASSGASSLEVKAKQVGGALIYDRSFSAKGMAYRVTAKLAVPSGTARLGLLWTGRGLSRWTGAPAVSGGGKSFRAVEFTSSAPPWASNVRLGVQLEAGTTALLDDVVLLSSGEAASQEIAQNNFRLVATDGGALDLLYGPAPILAHSALLPAGPGASIALEEQDGDHVLVTLQASAGTPGLEWEDVNAFLARDFRAFGADAQGEPFFRSELPDDAKPITGIRKMLLGPPGRAFAILGAGDEARLQATVRREGGRVIFTLQGAAGEEGAFRFRIKTGLVSEANEANSQIAQALNNWQVGKWGDFIRQAQGTLGEFPFADPERRRSLRTKLDEALRQFSQRAREAQEAIKAYDTFHDLASLDEAQAALDAMRDRFQVAPGAGEWGALASRLDAEIQSRRADADKKRQNEQAAWILGRAKFHLKQGEENSAAVFFAHVVLYLPLCDKAAEAAAELKKIEASHPYLAKVLEGIRKGGN
ncbi:MAG: FHA domain-containing protein [Planctomycetaceae bacterium]